jgi:hypothetical protein
MRSIKCRFGGVFGFTGVLVLVAQPARASIVPPCAMEVTAAGKAQCFEMFELSVRVDSRADVKELEEHIAAGIALLNAGGLTPDQVAQVTQQIKNEQAEIPLIGRAEATLLIEVWHSLFPPPLTPSPPEEWWFSPECNGQAVVASVAGSETCTLTLRFIDSSTGLPVTGPPIHSVLYEVNLDPSTPEIFLPLGLSFDAASNFSVPFIVNGFEPLVRVTAFDALNHQIVGAADGSQVSTGYVVMIAPEPSATLLTLLALAVSVRRGTMSRRRNRSGG